MFQILKFVSKTEYTNVRNISFSLLTTVDNEQEFLDRINYKVKVSVPMAFGGKMHANISETPYKVNIAYSSSAIANKIMLGPNDISKTYLICRMIQGHEAYIGATRKHHINEFGVICLVRYRSTVFKLKIIVDLLDLTHNNCLEFKTVAKFDMQKAFAERKYDVQIYLYKMVCDAYFSKEFTGVFIMAEKSMPFLVHRHNPTKSTMSRAASKLIVMMDQLLYLIGKHQLESLLTIPDIANLL